MFYATRFPLTGGGVKQFRDITPQQLCTRSALRKRGLNVIFSAHPFVRDLGLSALALDQMCV